MIHYDIEATLRPYLRSEEKLIWTGKPKTGISFRRSDFLYIPISFAWGAITIAWEISAMVNNDPLFFQIAGGVMVSIGLYLMIGRFFIDASLRSNTVYGITSERILFRTGKGNPVTEHVNITTIYDIEINQSKDRSGTITLRTNDLKRITIDGREFSDGSKKMELELIEEAPNVHQKIIHLIMEKKDA